MVWCFDHNFNNGVVDHYVADISTALDSAKCCFETYPYKVQNLHWLIPILKSLEFDKNELLRIHNRYYYPFGSPMDGRTFYSPKYRFGFNGKENDNEVKGVGSQQDYGMRIYDPRLGRFLSADPLIVYGQKYPELSTYQFASNTPIVAIDLDGLEAFIKLSVQNKEGKFITLHVFKWSDIHPNQEHGPWGEKGTITYTYLYQQRTKQTRYLDITTEYTATINGKEIDVFTRTNIEFRKKTNREKFKDWEDSFENKPPPPPLRIIANFNPLVTLADFVKINFIDKKNIYEEKASKVDKIINVLDVATLGMAEIGTGVVKSIGTIDNAVMDLVSSVKSIGDNNKSNTSESEKDDSDKTFKSDDGN